MGTIHLGTLTLEILPDESPENPRDWDNLGRMACWHRRHRLGDRHGYRDPRAFAEEVNCSNAIILPLFLFDHSGLTISTDPERFRACDQAGWDWGQVGYTFAHLEDVRREFGVRRVTRRVRERAEACLRAEVAVYDQFLRGEVFGFVLKDSSTGEVIDSCWGFFGENPWENGMSDHLPPDVRDRALSYFRGDDRREAS